MTELDRALVRRKLAAITRNLRDLGGIEGLSHYESFIELGRRGPLSPALAQRLAPAAGLRNRLVHEYDAIDDAIVLRAVGEARREFAGYVAEIEKYLAGTGK